jgi:hypothetical protein
VPADVRAHDCPANNGGAHDSCCSNRVASVVVAAAAAAAGVVAGSASQPAPIGLGGTLQPITNPEDIIQIAILFSSRDRK